MWSKIQRRCIDLSFKHGLTHLSSVLGTCPVLEAIYGLRGPKDPVVLGNSHAALALWAVLEAQGLCDAEEMLKRDGTHAVRDLAHGVWVSGGSLGQAETVAVGLALADQSRTVWLVTSDGACMEGSVAEAMRVAKRERLANLKVRVVANERGAYGRIEQSEILNIAGPGQIYYVYERHYPEWMTGLAGHYVKLDETKYQELINA